VQIVADAYSQALYRVDPKRSNAPVTLTEDDVRVVVQTSRLVPHTLVRARATREIGKTFGLGVHNYLGSIIEIEAVAFPAAQPGKGTIRFNDTAGSMAKDSVFNATSVLRAQTGIDVSDFDLHINIVGGGNIDGPSAGLAIFLALYSATTKTPLPQDVAITGELSIQGKIRAVGGVVEKLYAARQAGMRAMLLPKENAREVDVALSGVQIEPVATVDQALRELRVHKLSTRRSQGRSQSARRKTRT
jgi:ATP-dependent Lon protease